GRPGLRKADQIEPAQVRRVRVRERHREVGQPGDVVPRNVTLSGSIELFESSLRAIGLAGHVRTCIGRDRLRVAVVCSMDRYRICCSDVRKDSAIGNLFDADAHGSSPLDWLVAAMWRAMWQPSCTPIRWPFR